MLFVGKTILSLLNCLGSLVKSQLAICVTVYLWIQLCSIDLCVHAKLLQLFLNLCDPMDCSPPSFSVHGILQTRILEWVPFPSPGDLSDPGIEPGFPALQADSLPSEGDLKLNPKELKMERLF